MHTPKYNFPSKYSCFSLLCPEVQEATEKLVAVLEARGPGEWYAFSSLTCGSEV